MKEKKANIIIMFITLIIIFSLAEITVRAKDAFDGYNFFSNEHRDKISKEKKLILPFRTFGQNLYVKKGNEIYISSSHDELYPLKKSDSTFRIVCLGGSSTHDRWTFEHYGTHYPLLLQNLLQAKYPEKKVEVINLGYGAYATPHMLILLQLDVISWNPDLIIICENHNDLTAYIYPNFTFDYSNKYGSKYYLYPSYEEEYTTLNVLLRWSSFYWFIKDRWDKIFNKPVLYPKKLKSFGNEPPEINKYVFRRNLLNMYYIASKWGIKILYSTQAINPDMEPSEYITLATQNEVVVWPFRNELLQHHKIFNDIIKEVADTTHSYFLDNRSVLIKHPEIFIDNVHSNKEGSEMLANNYYKYIVSKNIIK